MTNTAANPTLNVNSTGAKPIYYRGSAIPAEHLAANRTYHFRYNGSQYELVGDLNMSTVSVTGIKGNAESSYRTGNVNLTPANLGLGNVNNTADSNKSVKYASSATTSAWTTIATSSSKPSQITEGTVRISDGGLLVSGLERCNARIDTAGNVQITTPTAFSNKNIVVDIFWR